MPDTKTIVMIVAVIAVVYVVFGDKIMQMLKGSGIKLPIPSPVTDAAKLTASEVDRIIKFCEVNQLDGLKQQFIGAAITRMKSE